MNHKPPSNDVMAEALRSAGVYAAGQPSAVDALIEQVLGPRAALLGKRSRRSPSRKSVDPVERAEAESTRTRHSRSLTQIAELLHCEGFSEFAALGALYYAKTRLWNQKEGDKIAERRRVLRQSIHELTAEQRKAIGQFIHLGASASFDAGLRIGLMASLWTLALCRDREGK